MAHCDEYIDLISAAIDGALTPAQQEKLEAHLAQCPDCRALKEELDAVHAALGTLPSVEPPADLYERIMTAVAADNVPPLAPVKKKTPAPWRKWAAAAAVFALVLVGYEGFGGKTKDVPETTATPLPELKTESAIEPFSLEEGDMELTDGETVTPALRSAGTGSSNTTQKSATMSDSPAATPAPSGDLPTGRSADPEPTAVPRAFVSAALASPQPEDPPGQDASEEPLPPANSALTAVSLDPEEAEAPEPSQMPPLRSAFSSLPPEETEPPANDLLEECMDAPSGDSSEEVGLTAREALDVLLSDQDLLEDTSVLTTEIISTWELPTGEEFTPGWQSPEWLVGDPDDPYCSQSFHYSGLNEDENIYWFSISQTAISLKAQEAQNTGDFIESPVQYGVPADGQTPFAVGN